MRLSPQQRSAMKLMASFGSIDDNGFYKYRIRMPTVRSLVRIGLVKQSKELVDRHWRYSYSLEETEVQS